MLTKPLQEIRNVAAIYAGRCSAYDVAALCDEVERLRGEKSKLLKALKNLNDIRHGEGGALLVNPDTGWPRAWDDMPVDDITPCPGCGSTETLADLQDHGFLACCPDRPGAPSYVEVVGLIEDRVPTHSEA